MGTHCRVESMVPFFLLRLRVLPGFLTESISNITYVTLRVVYMNVGNQENHWKLQIRQIFDQKEFIQF